MNRVRLNKELALKIFDFCQMSATDAQIREKFEKEYPSFNVLQHTRFLAQIKAIRENMWGGCVTITYPSPSELKNFLDLVILDEKGYIVYIRDDRFVGEYCQQSMLNITLPNPNDVDIIRFALATVLEDFASIEIVQKCEMSKPDVSNLKAMKRAVSLDKALEVVSKIGGAEKFVMLMSKLMGKRLQMMK
jgi:hypothetical protein